MTAYLKSNFRPLLLLFSTWGLYFIIYWPFLFFVSDSGDLTAGWRIVWADWAFHLSQAHAFAYQPFLHVLNNNPIYAGMPIAYPFATNLISGLLMKSGIGVTAAFVAPSIVYSLLLLLALYVFGKLITNNSAAAVLGIYLFLLSGGIEFYYYLQDVIKEPTLSTILYPPHHYSFLEEKGFYWKSVVLSSLIPQRSMLLGMPWMLFSLSFLLVHYRSGFSKVGHAALFAVGLFTGLLMIVHTHSLMVLSIICACLLAMDLKHYRHWLSFALGVAITAIPWLPFLVGKNTTGFFGFVPGWYAHESQLNEPSIVFWLRNWGVFFPMACLALFMAFNKEGRWLSPDKERLGKERYLFAIFLLLFILANLFRFQPHLWDNTKILVWSCMGLSFLVARLVVVLSTRSGLMKGVGAALVALMCFSGLIDLVKSLHVNRESHVMIPADHIEMGRKLRDLSDSDDIVMTSNNHLNFASTVTGRSVLKGYDGWLWSYNIDYRDREADIKKIYQGDPSFKVLLQKYGVDFVVVDSPAEKEYGADRSFFDNHFERVLSAGATTVYRLAPAPVEGGGTY